MGLRTTRLGGTLGALVEGIDFAAGLDESVLERSGLKRFMPNARITSSVGSSEGGTFGAGPRGAEGFMTLAGRPDLASGLVEFALARL